MKQKNLLTALIGSCVAVASADAALVIQYTFDDLPLGTNPDNQQLVNSGTLGGTATLTNGTGTGTYEVTTSDLGAGFGNALRFTPGADGDGNEIAPHIGTGQVLSLVGITAATEYTATAFVNFDNATGDNMIFGQNGTVANGGQSLHLGSRDGSLHSGHWGDDLNNGVTSDPGNWHHVAYTNDTEGNQAIYFDGVLVDGTTPGSDSAGTGGAFDTTQDLWIGTSNNGGSLSGLLDDVRVYDELLSAEEIFAISQVPEPGSVALLGVTGFAILLRRRRS